MENSYALSEELLFFIISLFMNNKLQTIRINEDKTLCIQLEAGAEQKITLPAYRKKEMEEILALFWDIKNKKKNVFKIEKKGNRYNVFFEENEENKIATMQCVPIKHSFDSYISEFIINFQGF